MPKKRKTNPKPSGQKTPEPEPQQQSKLKKRCGTCDYFDQLCVNAVGLDLQVCGKCRRHVPTVIIDNVPYPAPPNVLTVFPEVDADDWCGEHSDSSQLKIDVNPSSD